MAKIFISYSRSDKPVAERFARGLALAGHDVFWDAAIMPGVSWNDHIFKQLRDCDGVVVLWSSESVASNYVREEAEYARNEHKLIPILIDRIGIPFGFGQIHAVDMSGWSGSINDGRWSLVLEAIGRMHSANNNDPANSGVGEAVEIRSRGSGFMPSLWGVISIALAVVIAIVLFAAGLL